jgi:uncharacterized RDD family membrane protein YckC
MLIPQNKELPRIKVLRVITFFVEILIPNFVVWAVYFSPNNDLPPTATGLSVFLLIYLLFRDGFQGQSLGKRIGGLVVIDRTTGQLCGLGKSFLRNVDLVLPLMYIVEFFVLWFSKDGMRIGDRLANTQVLMVIDELPKKEDDIDLVD